jgi:glycosidase
MKLYINIVFALIFSSVLAACSTSDNESTPAPAYPQYGTRFEKMPKKEDAVIYQVNIRAFSESGTLKGVQDKLTYIQELGVNVIYLMPIYPVGQVRSAGGLGSPYSVKDYKAVNTEFGTLKDLQVLVEEAHKKNMGVILDWVANHTSWDNAWITAHPDWYQKDSSGNIIIPPGTNYNDVAQLDYTNKEMQKAMIDAMSYWVYTANIDGFRCDYADAVPQSFWTDANNSIRKIKNQNFLMLAEGSKVTHFVAGFDYTFGFGYFGALKKVFSEGKSATTIQDANAAEYATNYDNSQRIVRYTTNHDVNLSDGTPLELFGGKKGSIATFVVAAYMKSVPMIYNAQEVGYAKRIEYFTHTPIDWSTGDLDMLAEYKKIVAFRNSSNAIKRGTFKGYSSDAVSAFSMETDTEKVLVLSNLTSSESKYIVPAALSKMAWKDAFGGAAVTLTSEITLQPYQYVVLKN